MHKMTVLSTEDSKKLYIDKYHRITVLSTEDCMQLYIDMYRIKVVVKLFFLNSKNLSFSFSLKLM